MPLIGAAIRMAMRCGIRVPIVYCSSSLSVVFITRVSKVIVFLFTRTRSPYSLSTKQYVEPRVPVLLGDGGLSATI